MQYKYHVITSRPLTKLPYKDEYTYVKGLGKRKKKDLATPYLRCGMYTVAYNTYVPPVFSGRTDYTEWEHYSKLWQVNGYDQPGDETTDYFTQLFTALKARPDKVLYCYLFGFGNSVSKELNKHVSLMHQVYFKDTLGQGSPVGNLTFLTWPSQGILQYHNEADDVNTMGQSLAVLFLKMHYFIYKSGNPLFADWKPKIVLHAQSMGCRIIKKMTACLHEWNRTDLDGFFHRLILTGGDLDDSDLSTNDTSVPNKMHLLATRLVLVYSKNDIALWISKVIYQEGPRLGAEPELGQIPKNVELVRTSYLTHTAYMKKKRLIRMIFDSVKNMHADGTPLTNEAKFIVYNTDKDKIESADTLS